ncbi:MAG: hypothetical protein WC196_04460 [Bacilli bacterium]|jgi:hypothetical protein
MTEIQVFPEPQKIEGNWITYYLKSLEVSVTVSPKNYESRKLTATLEPPESAPVQIAVPIVPGPGTQPENTLTLMNVQDQAQLIMQQLEDAIKEVIKQKGDW